MQHLKDYSQKITEALDAILPKKIRCAIVLGDPETSEVSTCSNMTDAGTASLLEDGIEVLAIYEESEEIDLSDEDSLDNSKLN